MDTDNIPELKIIHINNFSLINIGKSNKSIIIVLIKTKLQLSDNFFSEPFGTTKMRFQYPEIFRYDILNKYKEKEFTIYKLQITKNTDNCKNISKYFWNEGWNLNLTISNFPLINNSIINKNKILELLPKNYGLVETEIKNVKDKFKIGIIIPFYNRSEYVETFLNSLKKTNIDNCLFIFMNESMTKEVDDEKKKVNTLVHNFNPNNFNIIKIHKNKHGNMFESILRGLDILSFYCNNLMTLDSDTIHKSDWADKCLNLLQKLSTKKNTPVLVSGFNTVNTGKHIIKKEFDSYYLKNTIGGCQICFSRETYFKYIRYTLISYKWDTNLVNNIITNKGIIAVTKPSVIDHIGFRSSGHRKEKTKIYDYALDFSKT